MGTLKFIVLLCSASICFASHQSHIIPVEGYETELQDLGQQVHSPETPVKVIKITKTVAVKVPVPYPVKVIEKVPYPVHVSKPYPVPVPHIVRIPHPVPVKSHHEQENAGADHQSNSNSYDVHESHNGPSPREYESLSENDSYDGSDHGGYQNVPFSNEHGVESGPLNSYGSANSFYGSPGHGGHNSFESKSYDQALQKYLDEHRPGSQNDDSGGHY